jgi:hypothetical protein
MQDKRQGERPDEPEWHAPETYLDMSLEERRRFIARLHAERSRAIGQAIARLARGMAC